MHGHSRSHGSGDPVRFPPPPKSVRVWAVGDRSDETAAGPTIGAGIREHQPARETAIPGGWSMAVFVGVPAVILAIVALAALARLACTQMGE